MTCAIRPSQLFVLFLTTAIPAALLIITLYQPIVTKTQRLQKADNRINLDAVDQSAVSPVNQSDVTHATHVTPTNPINQSAVTPVNQSDVTAVNQSAVSPVNAVNKSDFSAVSAVIQSSLNPVEQPDVCDQSETCPYLNTSSNFLLYMSEYGQFNNQIASLVSALFMARHLNAVLVLPYTNLGRESTADVKNLSSTELQNLTLPGSEKLYQLVGDYFSHKLLAERERLIPPHIFINSYDARKLRDKLDLPVRMHKFYKKLLSVDRLTRSDTENAYSRFLGNRCNFTASGLRDFPYVHYGRFFIFPIVFGQHDLNCSLQEPDWISIRSHLAPRVEFQTAVDNYLETLARPILCLHLRIFLDGDISAFTTDSFVEMLERDYGPGLHEARTLFISFTRSSELSWAIIRRLETLFPGRVAYPQDIEQYFSAGHSSLAHAHFSAVLFDMWVCVRGDAFIGRLGSSLSWNVVYWRKAFRTRFRLLPQFVDQPFWYSLSNFSNNGASRNETNFLSYE